MVKLFGGQVNNSLLPPDEREAIEALDAARKAVSRALELSVQAGYGSQVLGPLGDAVVNIRYAHGTATGRN